MFGFPRKGSPTTPCGEEDRKRCLIEAIHELAIVIDGILSKHKKDHEHTNGEGRKGFHVLPDGLYMVDFEHRDHSTVPMPLVLYQGLNGQASNGEAAGMQPSLSLVIGTDDPRENMDSDTARALHQILLKAGGTVQAAAVALPRLREKFFDVEILTGTGSRQLRHVAINMMPLIAEITAATTKEELESVLNRFKGLQRPHPKKHEDTEALRRNLAGHVGVTLESLATSKPAQNLP